MIRNTIYILFLLITMSQLGFAQDDYTSSIMFTIPWGNDPDELSSDFQTSESIEIFEPGPWAVSDNGELVIVDHRISASNPSVSEAIIKKFDISGNLTAYKFISDLGIELYRPYKIAILNSGDVIISSSSVPQKIFLLDNALNLLHEISLPFSDTYSLDEFTPTVNGSFWLAFIVLEEHGSLEYQQYYKTEIFLDGTYTTPELTWDDIANNGIPARYISPSGEPYLFNADMYGDIYTSVYDNAAYKLHKWRLNQQGTEYAEIYTHNISSDPGWEFFETLQNTGSRYFITWSGDFYSIHATDDGMVLTKYTYHPE